MKRREFLTGSVALTGAFLPRLVPAASRPCSPPRVAVAGGSSAAAVCADGETQLARVVQRLKLASPDAPAWSDAEIGASSLNANVHHWGDVPPDGVVLGGRPPFAAPNHVSNEYNILDWPGKAHWDPVNGDWWFSGGPTGNQGAASPTIVRYRSADDRFVHWQGKVSGEGGIWPPNGHAHSFDAADLDVTGRKIWRHLVPHKSQDWGFRLGWFNIDTHESGQFAGGGWDGTYPTISFMPDNRLLHVIRGQAGGSSNIRRFDVDELAMSGALAGPAGRAGPSCYHKGAIYYSTDQRHFSAILPNGSVESRSPTPIVMDRSIQNHATYSILLPLGEFVYAFCGNGDIWRYDPTRDSWGDAPYHSIPWLWPYDSFSATGWHYIKQACVGPVPAHDAAIFCLAKRFRSEGTVPSRSLVWKP